MNTLNKNDMIDIIKAQQIRQSIKRKFNIITIGIKFMLKTTSTKNAFRLDYGNASHIAFENSNTPKVIIRASNLRRYHNDFCCLRDLTHTETEINFDHPFLI